MSIHCDFLSKNLCENAFAKILEECEFETLYQHRSALPRLVHIQTSFDDDGSHPIYRKPLDVEPELHSWTPTVESIRQELMAHFRDELKGQDLNHVVIQLYRDGSDWCGLHSDKTLDIALGTAIYNLTLYESVNPPENLVRCFKLVQKTKDNESKESLEPKKQSTHASTTFLMRHNSCVVLDWSTNHACTHMVPKLNQPPSNSAIKSCARLSLTFRTIATFMRPDMVIYGQGSVWKTKTELKSIISDKSIRDATQRRAKALSYFAEHPSFEGGRQAVLMYKAFGIENKRTQDFDWSECYGGGFLCLDSVDESQFHETALLVIDAQNEFLNANISPYFSKKHKPLSTLIQSICDCIQIAQERQMPIFNITSEYELKNTKTQESNEEAEEKEESESEPPAATHIGNRPCCVAGSVGAEMHPQIRACMNQHYSNVTFITKNYYSAFASTLLHASLQQRGIKNLKIVGIHTNCCVKLTCIDALKFGYRVEIIESACGAMAENVHRKAIRELEALGCVGSME